MKNLKIILGVAIIAALTFGFASCGDPEPDPDPSVTWTVTLDLSAEQAGNLPSIFLDYIGNTASSTNLTKTLTVQDGQTLPSLDTFGVYKNVTTAPSANGLYYFLKPATWKEEGKTTAFDVKTAIRANLKLQPLAWETTPAAVTGVTSISAAVTKANEGKPYIYKFSSAENANGLRLTSTNAGLLVYGTGAGSIITLNGDAPLFTVGGDKTNTLILNNATLKGKAGGSKGAAVFVRDGAFFEMQNGSAIDGFSSDGTNYVSDTNNAGFGAAAIHVDAATFIFNGGTISNNTNTYAAKNGLSAGAVYVEARGNAYLNGGTFSDNVNANGTKDIYFTYSSSITLGGNTTAEIGFGSIQSGTNGKITVNSGFTDGSITINLAGAKNDWNNKTILQGVTSSQTSKFSAGNYLPKTTSNSFTGSVNASGVLTIN